MIDTHCHLTYEPLSHDAPGVLARARSAGVTAMVSVGTSPDDSRQAAVLAGEADVYATAGLHPHYAQQWTDKPRVVDTLRELIANPKVVALGEMGLDKHYPEPSLSEQRRVFQWQLEVAAEAQSAGKPLVIHNREATDEVLAMLRAVLSPTRNPEPGTRNPNVVFHCFTGGPPEVEKILEFGAFVGITGIVTFRNAAEVAEAARRVPLDRLLIETDSPYLTPEPHRKARPNEPRYLPHIAEFLARQRGMAMDEFLAAVDGNARRLFGLPG